MSAQRGALCRPVEAGLRCLEKRAGVRVFPSSERRLAKQISVDSVLSNSFSDRVSAACMCGCPALGSDGCAAEGLFCVVGVVRACLLFRSRRFVGFSSSLRVNRTRSVVPLLVSAASPCVLPSSGSACTRLRVPCRTLWISPRGLGNGEEETGYTDEGLNSEGRQRRNDLFASGVRYVRANV